MATYAFAAPILPGTLPAWRDAVREMKTTRRADMAASRKRAGVTREDVWLQQTPMGDFAVVSLDAADVDVVFRQFMTSTDPFDRWFRDTVLAGVHGLDPAGPPPPMNERMLG